MTIYHKELTAGRWSTMPFLLQMANTASEVERALNRKEKGDEVYANRAAERAIELMDLTLCDPKNRSRLKELARAREAFTDFFWGDNEYNSSATSWRSYYSQFSFAARRDH
jgi:hypothetical protein